MRREVSKRIKEFASENRKKMTDAEVLLWVRFRTWRAQGIVIRRQHSVATFIADFARVKAKLLIELDGSSHEGKEAYDQRREAELAAIGWTVMRFENWEVIENPTEVASQVLERICMRVGIKGSDGDDEDADPSELHF